MYGHDREWADVMIVLAVQGSPKVDHVNLESQYSPAYVTLE
jgi:hypothetical protein